MLTKLYNQLVVNWLISEKIMKIKIFTIIAILLLGAGTSISAQNKKDKMNVHETVLSDVPMTC